MSKHIKVGSLVAVRFIEDEKIINIGAKKYKGCVTTVVKKRELGAYGTMYELDGCVSDLGVPFTFTDDYLELVEDNDGEGISKSI